MEHPTMTHKRGCVPWVRVWLVLMVFLVFSMILVGGVTRLTDSGLSITEWQPIVGIVPPLTEKQWLEAFDKYKKIPEYYLVNNGMALKDFQFIFWWEWGHRFLGRLIGLAFALPLIFFSSLGFIERKDFARYVGVFMLGGIQGAVGWYMVSSGLVDRVDVSQYRLALHLIIAFLLLGLLMWLAMEQRTYSYSPHPQRLPRGSALEAFCLVGLLYIQVLWGAFVAGLKAGLVFNTWPLMNGNLFPPDLFALSPWLINFFENTTTVQFTHRFSAYGLVGFGIWHAGRLLKAGVHGELCRSSILLASIFIFQMALGIATVLYGVPLGLGSAHQGVAALCLIVLIRHLWLVRHSAKIKEVPASV